ncbi:MAG TPA: hypothetical protein VFH61_12150, partial [Thermoleophilia bacterium]|nr:hypothetical protein [Thermoleophilia bacterium]
MGTYDELVRYHRRSQGRPDPIAAMLERARQRDLMGQQRPPAPDGPQSFQPEQSAAEVAYQGARAAGMQALDYPGMAEGAAGLFGAMAERGPGGPAERAMRGAGRGVEGFREATPGLAPWRNAVDRETELAIRAGVPLLGILGAGALMGGVGPEDAMSAAMKGGKGLDEAVGAARVAARKHLPTAVGRKPG